MFTFYIIALLIGGTLVSASLFFGGDGDADHPGLDMDFDADMDMDVDADVDADADGDADQGGGLGDALTGWFPITSMRFWTFFLAFFGLTGTLMHAGKFISSPIAIAAVAIGIGYLCGYTMTAVVRRLMRDVVDSSLGERDYVGEVATVTLPISPGQAGKIRMQVKGRTIELLAISEDTDTFALNSQVIVYGVKDNGRVVVTRAGELPAVAIAANS